MAVNNLTMDIDIKTGNKLQSLIRTLESTRISGCMNTNCKFHDMNKLGIQQGFECTLKNIDLNKNGQCVLKENK